MGFQALTHHIPPETDRYPKFYYQTVEQPTMVAPSLADYAEQTILSDVTVSPSGDRIAYVATEFDLEGDERHSSVFVAPTDGASEPHRLTRTSEVSSPKWSPDGNRLAVLDTREADTELAIRNNDSDGQPDDGDEPSAQVWIYDLDLGGDARQVTTREEGVSEYDWAPDGNRIVVAAEDPTADERAYRNELEDGGPIETRRLQHKYDGSGWLDTVTTYLFVVDVETREETRLDDAYGSGASEPATGLSPVWSPEGDRIAFLSNRTDRPDNSSAMDVYTIRPDGTEVNRHTDAERRCSGLRWSPDGSRIAFYGRISGDMYEPTGVYVTDVYADDDPRSIAASLDRPTGRGGPLCWTGNDTILTAIGDEGLTRLVRLDATDDAPERVFERQGQYRTVSTVDAAGDTLALIISDPQSGTDVYVMDVADVDAKADAPDPLTRLTQTDASLFERYDPPQCERITVRSDGDGIADAEIESIVYLPAEFDPATDDPLPTIVSIHGGPVSYDAPEHKFSYLHWTNRGYAVIRTNYRGSSSYGKAFSESISGEWGVREPADVENGVEELIDRGWADPERLFVTGFSYGGVTTGFVLTRSDRFRAGAAEHGIYDRYAYFGTGDSHNRMEADFGLPWEDEETYRSISSITDVGDIDTPLLITAGGEDWRCPPTQSEQLYVSVKKQGVPAKLVVYPDENHAVSLPKRAIHRLEAIDDWFDEFDLENDSSQ